MPGLISIIFGGIELVVGLRFLFLLLGANPSAQAVDWIYNASAPFVAPFAGVLGQSTTIAHGAATSSVFEPSSLIALLVYGAVGGILIRFFATHEGR